MGSLLLFIPDELLPLMLVGAGLAFVVGARSLGVSLIVTVLALTIMPMMLAPFFEALPMWLIFTVVGVLIVGACFSLMRGFSNTLIGTNATDHVVGSLAADGVRAVLGGMARLAWLPFRLVWRGLARLLRP